MASFFFDNDANLRIGRRLERLGHALTSTHAQRIEQASDAEVLRWAAAGGLILVTHNERDFVALHLRRAADRHAGILVVPQVASEDAEKVAAAIDQLVLSSTPLVNELCRLHLNFNWTRWDEEAHQWALLKS